MSRLIQPASGAVKGLGDPRSTGAGRPIRSLDVLGLKGTLKGGAALNHSAVKKTVA